MLIPIFQILLQTRSEDTTAGELAPFLRGCLFPTGCRQTDFGMHPNTQDESATPLRVKENPHNGVENKHRHGSSASSLH